MSRSRTGRSTPPATSLPVLCNLLTLIHVPLFNSGTTHESKEGGNRIAGRCFPTCTVAEEDWRHRTWQTSSNGSRASARNPPLATDNLLENTDGVLRLPHQCSLGTAACYLLVMLTRAILIPSLFQKAWIAAKPTEAAWRRWCEEVTTHGRSCRWRVFVSDLQEKVAAHRTRTKRPVRKSPLATKNLLEDTDGLRRPP